MANFGVVGISESSEEEMMDSIDVVEFRKFLFKNAVDIGDGKSAVCMDLNVLKDMFRGVCIIETEFVREKEDMRCNPVSFLAGRIREIVEHGVSVDDDGKSKYCIVLGGVDDENR